MPMYEYKCSNCEHKLEVYRPMTESDDQVICPDCGVDMERYYGDQVFWNEVKT